MDVGLKGAYIMIKYFGELMYKKNDGSIINIGSDLSVIAPNQKIYNGVYKNYFRGDRFLLKELTINHYTQIKK